MKISFTSDYALQAIAFLSTQSADGRYSINQIAEAASLPRDFLAKILKKLTVAKIVRSYKGIYGGYQLTKPPQKITVLEVIEAIDGPLALNMCIRGEHGPGCKPSGNCAIYKFFAMLQTTVRKKLEAQKMNQFKKK
jgi:Rrf2 family protein